MINDTSQHPVTCHMDVTNSLNIKSFLGVPILLRNGDFFGSLCALDTEYHTFTDKEFTLLETMAKSLAYVIELEQSKEKLEGGVTRLIHQNELILNAVGEGIFGLDLDGNTTFVNPAAAKMIGYEVHELIGKNQHSILHHSKPDGSPYPIEECPISASLNGKVSHVTNEVFWKRDGTSFPVEYVSAPIYEQGETTGAVVTFRDISERHKSEKELRDSERRFRSVFQSAKDAIILTDQSLNIISWNKGAQSVFNYTELEMLGQKVNRIIPDRFKEGHRKGVKNYQSTGTSKVIGRTMELYGLRKDGAEIPIELSINTWKTNHRQYYCAIIRDITQRKQAEEEIRKSEERYRQLVEHSPDTVIILRKEELLYINDTGVELLGADSKEQIIGRSAYLFAHPDHYESLNDLINKVEFGNTIGPSEGKMLTVDRQMIDVELIAIPSIYQGEPAVHVIVRDIRERKKTEQLLLNSEKLSVAGQLAAGIAHEIRNPLTAIKGFLHLMRHDFGENEPYLDIIKSEMNRIEIILSELLVLAKPQDAKFEKKDVSVLLEHVTTLINTQAIMNNIEIQTDIETDLPLIDCDENQLKQVFINFLKNSIEAMHEGGKIHIQVRNQDSEKLILRFIDQGGGIPEEVLSKLGQPFVTTKENGTGLGLTVCHQIIENHHGNIHITSGSKGTTIQVDLPIT
jgi:two-component system sporulation sensor kinase A